MRAKMMFLAVAVSLDALFNASTITFFIASNGYTARVSGWRFTSKTLSL